MNTRNKTFFSYAPTTEIQIPSHVRLIEYNNEDHTCFNGVHSSASEIEEKELKNTFIQVGVNDFNIGENLYTGSMGPCQGVITRFTNGLFALYHASNPFPDDTFQSFKKAYQARGLVVNEIVIIEKLQGNKANRVKAPFLTVIFGENFDIDANKVKRIQVPNYSSIACVDGKALICENLILKKNNDKNEIQFFITPGETVETISYATTFALFIKLQNAGTPGYGLYKIKNPNLTQTAESKETENQPEEVLQKRTTPSP